MLSVLLAALLSLDPRQQPRQSAPVPSREQVQSSQRGADSSSPTTPSPATSIAEQRERDRERDQRDREALVWNKRGTTAQIIFAVVGAAVALLQLSLLREQKNISERQRSIAEDQNRIALEQNDISREQKAIAVRQTSIAEAQTSILESQAATQRGIERGYVTLSNAVPGLEFRKKDENPLDFEMKLEIKNSGNSPVVLTGVSLVVRQIRTGLPPSPTYDQNRAIRMMVAQGDTFSLDESWRWTQYLDLDQLRADLAGGWRYMVIGYVDYRDIFGVRHRAGYGREYSAEIDQRFENNIHRAQRNNLAVIVAPGYNYDRPRKRDEGFDWDED